MSSKATRFSTLPFVITIAISAFLLFQVQPLIAKFILPWFGGSPSVWTTSLLFFQTLLLVGYAYAHLSIRRFSPKMQMTVHLVLLVVALAQLPVAPSEIWKPSPDDQPALQIFLLLAASIGLPYVVLSATAPLVQAWFSRTHPGVSPYRLYAVSNAGSLLALLTFPFVFEPSLTRTGQSSLWSAGFVVFGLACAYVAYSTWRKGASQDASTQEAEANSDPDVAPGIGDRVLWLALPAIAVMLLLAVTNQITLDVAAIPFLWVLPLSLYLLTFIIAFDSPRWYYRPLFLALLIPAYVLIVGLKFEGVDASIYEQVGGFAVVLLLLCMVMHGELSRLRPHPRYLTGYFLMISLGGALGGLFVAVIAPQIFTDFFELHVGIVASALVVLVILYREREELFAEWGNRATQFGGVALGLGFVALTVALVMNAIGIYPYWKDEDNRLVLEEIDEVVVLKSRNFYGVTTVVGENEGTPDQTLWFRNGAIWHGMQFTADERSQWPTMYFSEISGVGITMRNFRAGEPRNIGIVGLGVGTLAAYGQPGDSIWLYEINPDVQYISDELFTYLQDTPAETTVVMGDARLSLEREPDHRFDVLVLDAFSSDSLPVHLLTVEAFETYLRHLEPDGIILIDITNRHLDLEPLVHQMAGHFDMVAVHISNSWYNEQGGWPADWMLVSANRDFLSSDVILQAASLPNYGEEELRLWTDEYTSLFEVLREPEPLFNQ